MPDINAPSPSVDQIPLPDQLPAPADFSHLPPEVLHTSTVETLISQNQDLMTRLSVNIRRVADLEIALRTRDENLRSVAAQKDAVQEEFEIVSEKYRTLRAQTDRTRLEKEGLEKSFAEIHSRYQETQARLQEENYFFRGLLGIMNRYRMRVRKYVKPLLKRQKQTIAALVSRVELTEKELSDTRDWMQSEISERQSAIDRLVRYRRRMRAAARPRVDRLERELGEMKKLAHEQAMTIEELQSRSDRLQKLLTEQIDNFDSDQSRLVAYHEDRWQSLKAESEKALSEKDELLQSATAAKDALAQETERLKNKVSELEAAQAQAVQEMASFENRVIRAERTQEELEKKRIGESETARNDRARLETQLEKAAAALEDLRARDAAASALNRRLSQDLNNLRKENEQLRLRLRAVKAPETASAQLTPPPPSGGNHQLERIERLLAEIQSGHSSLPTGEEII
ncbi:MAG TPA: hypothetical protein VFV50_06625 [Bdellovibrionales bacterium]|nr:hypothetical protein [Bdellovibrionales bacterium]